jgi:hypothetical protein
MFRPFYSGYTQGSVAIQPTQNGTGLVDREFNFVGWNISQLKLVVRFWGAGGWTYFAKLRLYFSLDKGETYTHYYDLPDTFVDLAALFDIPWGNAYCEEHTYTIPSSEYQYYTPNTRIKLMQRDTYILYLANVYWGSSQSPVPPYDYRDIDNNYVQYYIYWNVTYIEQTISYTGSTHTLNSTTTREKAKLTADAIKNTFHPSGAGNEIVGKSFGTDSWIVIYSSQLAVNALIKLAGYIPESSSSYLVMAKRFITWMWTKQEINGSFPFYLVDGDQHVSYYIHVDSFSALALTITWNYYQATGDTGIINDYWDNIVLCGSFLESLNSSYAIPYDSYYSNDNGGSWVKNRWSLLHDTCEMYEGLKALANLYNFKGDTENKNKFNNWANNMKTAIDIYFWNETLQRYVGFFDMIEGTQDTTAVYSMITPIIYRVTTNTTRLRKTLTTYLSWNIMGGRYYNTTWASDYSVQNEYSTMAGMIFKAIAILYKDYGSISSYYSQKYWNATDFLWANPIYGSSLFKEGYGFLDWVRFSDATYAPDYARLVEASAWYLEGIMESDPPPKSTPEQLDPMFAYEMGEFVRDDTAPRFLLFDSSRNKNYGTFNSTEQAPTQVIGKLGYGLLFDGDDYVNVSDSASMRIYPYMTICVWIYPQDISLIREIIVKPNEYWLGINSSRIQFKIYDGSSWHSVFSDAIIVDNWYFIVAELSLSEMSLYIDNVLANHITYTEDLALTNNNVTIGLNFLGIIDELQGYHRLLDDTEKVLAKMTQIPMPSNYVFVSGQGDYGFYDNHLETPYANNGEVEVSYYIMGFQTFHSAITINQSGSVSDSSYFEWSFSFYKAGKIQVVYQLDIKYTNLATKQVTLNFSRLLPKTESTVTYKTVNLDLNGTGPYATAWKIAVDAGNYIDEKTFQIRVISDTQTQVVVDTLTGNYYWEYFFDLVDEDGNTVNLGYYDAFVKAVNYLSAGYGITVMIPEHTHFAWMIVILILYIIVASASIGLAVYTMQGGKLSDIPIIGGALQTVSDWITTLANAIGRVLSPIGKWITDAFISTMTPVVNAIISAGQALWSLIVQGMDTLLSFSGNAHLFTDIINFLGTLVTNIGNAFTFIGTLLTQGFTLLGAFFSNVATIITSFVGTFVSMWNYFCQIVGGAYGVGVDFWNMAAPVLPSLLTLLAIGYVIWLIVLWEEQGLGAVIDHFRGLFDIAAFILGTLLHIAQVFIQFVNGLIEALPF